MAEQPKLTFKKLVRELKRRDLLIIHKKKIKGYHNEDVKVANVFVWAKKNYGRKGFRQCDEFFKILDKREWSCSCCYYYY